MVEIVQRHDQANVVLAHEVGERVDVSGIGDQRHDRLEIRVVERRRERVGVCSEGAAPAARKARTMSTRWPAQVNSTVVTTREGTRRTWRGLRATTVAPLTCDAVSPEPIRVLRVIARLNMGGPAIHVANLAAGLETRGYHTTLVAGSLARGEDSMAFLAERLGVSVVSVEELQREVSVLHDARSVLRIAS